MAAKYIDERLVLPDQFTPGKIGVVTVLYNSALVLEDFFRSLDQQRYKNFIVYCIDNASTDDSVAQCRSKAGRYVVIENGSNLGVAAGNNVGTRAAVADGCEFVLYLNNDVAFGPELFDMLVQGLVRHECSMTTPMMYFHDKPDVIWAAGGFFQPWLGYRCQHLRQFDIDRGKPGPPSQVSYTPTCCVLVRRELFAEIGIMDERYFVYYDDTDFMLRSWKHGRKLFLIPQARLWHKVSSLAGVNSPFMKRYLTRNHALYNHKNVNAPSAWLVSVLYRIYFPVMWLRGRMEKREAFEQVRYWNDGMRIARQSSK
jgi:GT2 family glycosyltransferase